jgi:creatinine amidohydrolase
MGSDPYLAKADHGERFLDLAATALAEDLQAFLEGTS